MPRRCLAVAAILVCVLLTSVGGFAQILDMDGSLESFLTIQPPFAATRGGLTLETGFELGCLDASVRAGWDLDSFARIEFLSQVSLADWRIRSRIRFSPEDMALTLVRFEVRGSIGEVFIGNVFSLYKDPADSYDELTLRGSVEGVAIDCRIRASLCPQMSFQRAVFRGNWVGLPCRIPMEIRMAFDEESGFDHLRFRARDIPLLESPSGWAGLDGGLSIQFEPESKRVSPALDIDIDPLCVEFIPTLAILESASGWGMEGIALEGVEILGRIDDETTLTMATSFVDSANQRIVGESRFFERATLEGSLPGCCGGGTSYGVTMFFLRDPEPATAFGWGRFEGWTEISLGEDMDVRCEIRFDASPADPAWSFEVRVEYDF